MSYQKSNGEKQNDIDMMKIIKNVELKLGLGRSTLVVLIERALLTKNSHGTGRIARFPIDNRLTLLSFTHTVIIIIPQRRVSGGHRRAGVITRRGGIIRARREAKKELGEQRTSGVIGDDKRSIDAYDHEYNAARVSQKVREKRVHATRESRLDAELPAEAELD